MTIQEVASALYLVGAERCFARESGTHQKRLIYDNGRWRILCRWHLRELELSDLIADDWEEISPPEPAVLMEKV